MTAVVNGPQAPLDCLGCLKATPRSRWPSRCALSAATLTLLLLLLLSMFLLLVQSLLPPLQAASQLSQAELEELLAENAKLKQLLSTYKDRLAPEQVRACVCRQLGLQAGT